MISLFSNRFHSYATRKIYTYDVSLKVMDASDMLLCIAQHSQGRIYGKTVAQKLMYFCCEMTGIKLGYIPHYYGPYSQTVDNLLSNLSSSDFLLDMSNLPKLC